MDNNKYLQWIDIVENLRDEKTEDEKLIKRRDAFATELLFSDQILNKLTGSKRVSTGWCHVELNKRDKFEKTQKLWVKFQHSEADDNELEVDRAFQKFICSNPVKESAGFLVVAWDSSQKEFFVKRHMVRKDSSSSKELLESPGSFINLENMKATLDKLKLSETITDSDGFSQKYLAQFSSRQIMELLAQRILLNNGFSNNTKVKNRPIDIDAIELTEKNEIKLHEFKRKDVMHKPSMKQEGIDIEKFEHELQAYVYELFLKNQENLKNLSTLIDQFKTGNYSSRGEAKISLENEVAKSNYTKQEISKIRNKVREKFIERKFIECDFEGGHFGLDYSHYSMVKFCTKYNLDYQYTIADSTALLNKLKKEKKDKYYKLNLADIIKLNTLKKYNFSPDIDIITKNVIDKDFNSFTFTIAEESGTYWKSLRVQKVIARASFTRV